MDEWWVESPPREVIDLGDVRLRRWESTALDRLYAAVMASLPELVPWMPWAAGFDRDSALHFLEVTSAAWDAGREYTYAIEQDEKVVGSSGLHARVERGGLEIGYWVRTSHTGRGIATRTAAALTAEAFTLPAVAFVEIRHDRANDASRRIPERLGFTLVEERMRDTQAPGETGIECVWRSSRAAYDQPVSEGR
jgi:ribosomal-protein-serine acetyltransferase